MNPHDMPGARDGVTEAGEEASKGRPSLPSRLEGVEEALWQLQSAMNSSLNAIALSDLKGVFTYINQAFVSLWGFDTISEIVGRSAVAFLGSELTPIFRQVPGHIKIGFTDGLPPAYGLTVAC